MSYDDQDEMDYLEQERVKYEKFLKNDATKLELGKTYLRESSSWAKAHYKIIFVNEDIAVGVKVYCGIYKSTKLGCGEYDMFKVKTGERYGDSRLGYRLKAEVK